MNKNWALIFILIFFSFFLGLAIILFGINPFFRLYTLIFGRKTVEQVLSLYDKKVESNLIPIFKEKNIDYPPKRLTFLAFKEEKFLEIWTTEAGKPIFIKRYPFTTTSGKRGPKLNRGDGQIPEGFYKIESLNPNSAFHLSLKINYPNEFDLNQATKENRSDPGDNIFIHGKDKSIGCIAIGDEAIEELFVISAKIPRSNLDAILFPYDMRNMKNIKICVDCPVWTNELYNRLQSASQNFIN